MPLSRQKPFPGFYTALKKPYDSNGEQSDSPLLYVYVEIHVVSLIRKTKQLGF